LILRTIFCLGYQVLENKQEQKRLKLIKLPNVFLQINGYKPQPLDLNNIALSQKLEELVELLAENTHNVWAKERIKSGWTYGVCEVGIKKISIKKQFFKQYFFKSEYNTKTPSLFIAVR
jgi:ryanodine receptor 2